MSDDRLERLRWLPLAFFMMCAVCVPSLQAELSDNLDREFEFISGLVELNFADYAERVTDEIARRHPDEQDRIEVARAEVLIARRKFDEAEKIIKSMDAQSAKAQTISLALANGYYRYGNLDKAKELYKAFFDQYKVKQPEDENLKRFYQEAAYRYGQMLKNSGNLKETAQAYDLLIASDPEPSLARRLKSEQAVLYLRLGRQSDGKEKEEALQKAEAICKELQWGGYDIWFGKASITLAQIELARGNEKGAREILDEYMDQLKEIDAALEEEGYLELSPLAGARYLKGQLYQQRAAQLKQSGRKEDAIQAYAVALQEFYNVFIKYGESEWGPDAGNHIKEIEDALAGLGKKVNVLGDAKKELKASFKVADNLYQQEKYQEAAEEYLQQLNNFPDTPNAPSALSRLLMCQAELGNEWMFKAVAAHMAERYANNQEAGIGLLRAGKFYYDREASDMYNYAYNLFLEYFPEHDKAPSIVYTLAALRKKSGDLEGANELYERIIEDYPEDKYATRAMNQLAWRRYNAGNYEPAIEWFQKYIEITQSSYERAVAQFALATSLKELERYSDAIDAYGTLISWLAPKENNNYRVGEEPAKINDLLEKTVFSRAFCYAEADSPKDKVDEYRSEAAKAYRQFVVLFPASEYAPTALSGIGGILLEQGKVDEASRTFDELAEKYPESDEGQDALYSLVSSAIRVEQFDEARAAFNKMMNNDSAYTAQQFVRIGNLMLDSGFYEEAVQALSKISVADEERAIVERALYGLGKANYGLENYDEAVQALEQLLEKYPNSAKFYDAKFALGSAYRKAGQPGKATAALRDVFKYAQDTALRNRANVELAAIQRAEGDLDGALASHMRFLLFADENDKETRPMLETSLMEAVELAGEMQRYQDVMDLTDQYIRQFPQGEHLEEMRRERSQARVKLPAAD